MKSSATCLHTEQIHSLLAGDLPPLDTSAIEDHLAECEVCRSAVEAAIGDDHWWDDARQSLSAGVRRLDGAVHDAAHDVEPNTTEQLLELLGPTDDPAMLGRIGSYEIVGILGRGGMGAVFKGFDSALNRFVAIKVLLPHLATSGAARKRFAREAQAAAAVVDDHVMAIHGVSEWNSTPYFVMTYARGVSLQKRLSDNGPLELREILRIGMQAARGLAAAHAQGLVHRDIKPANIFLDDGVERVQLMDFGLARAVDDASLTRSGVLAGTPQYMSPEQARAEAVDARSDLFSLGAVLYAMCTGYAPFRAESSHAVLRLITDHQPRPIREINPDISEWLCVIIDKLMSKQADDRFESAAQVAMLLESCLAHVQEPTRVSLPRELFSIKPQPSPRPVSSWKRAMLMAGTIGTVLLGTILISATNPPDISGRWLGDGWGEVVLEQADGKGKVYSGSFQSASGNASGKLALKWSRTERRFNGTWTDGSDGSGKLSLRLDGDDLRGAVTENQNDTVAASRPRLADLHWQRIPIGIDISGPTIDGDGRLLVQTRDLIATQTSTAGPRQVSEGLVTVSFTGIIDHSTISSSSIGWVIDDTGHILVPSLCVPTCDDEQIELRYSRGERCPAKRVRSLGQLTLLKSEQVFKTPLISLNGNANVAQGDSVMAILNGTDIVAGKVTNARKTFAVSEMAGVKVSPPLRFQDVITTDIKRDEASLSGAPLLTKNGDIAGMFILLQEGPSPVIPVSEIQVAREQFNEVLHDSVPEAVRPLYDRLQGTWLITKAVEEGVDGLREFDDRAGLIVVEGKLLTVHGSNRGRKFELGMLLEFLQPGAPQPVNVLIDPNDAEPNPLRPGIIECKADLLRFCCRSDSGAGPENRPKVFSGSGQYIWLYEARRVSNTDGPSTDTMPLATLLDASKEDTDVIVIDVFCGAGVLTRMNGTDPNPIAKKHIKLLTELQSIEGVTVNFRESGPGQDIPIAIVRDSSHRRQREAAATGQPSAVEAAIRSAMTAAGIKSVRWEETAAETQAGAEIVPSFARPLRDRTQGTWVITKLVADGDDVLGKFDDRAGLIVVEGELLTMRGKYHGHTLEGVWQLKCVEEGSPQPVDVMTDPNDTESNPPRPGIMDCDGNRFRLCFRSNSSESPASRPKVFTGNGKNIMLVEARRASATPDPNRATDEHGSRDSNASDSSSRLLAAVVGEFNERQQQHPVGKSQPPLTVDEVLTSIRAAQRDPFSGAEFDEEAEMAFTLLKEIGRTGIVPQGWKMEVETEHRFDSQDVTLTLWNVRLTYPISEGQFNHPIRTQALDYSPKPDRDQLRAHLTLVTETTSRTPLFTLTEPGNIAVRPDLPTIPNRKSPSYNEIMAGIIYYYARHEDDLDDSVQEELEAVWETYSLNNNSSLELGGAHATGDFEFVDANLMLAFDTSQGRQRIALTQHWVESRPIRRTPADDISWGPAAIDGLELGVKLSPVEGSTETGPAFRPTFYFRNLSGKTVVTLEHVLDYEVDAFTDTGIRLPVTRSGEVSRQGGRLPPTEITGRHRMERIGIPFSISFLTEQDFHSPTAFSDWNSTPDRDPIIGIGGYPLIGIRSPKELLPTRLRLRFHLHHAASFDLPKLLSGEVQVTIDADGKALRSSRDADRQP